MVRSKASKDIVRAWVGKKKNYHEECPVCSRLFAVTMVLLLLAGGDGSGPAPQGEPQ